MFVQGIRPPTVPVGTARLRVSLAADHSAEQIEKSVKLLGRLYREKKAAQRSADVIHSGDSREPVKVP